MSETPDTPAIYSPLMSNSTLSPASPGQNSAPRWFVRGDIDGFFGLFVDNLLQLLLISALCSFACGFDAKLIVGTILPGSAISVLLGNLFYAWQARQLMRKTGRSDITALPFGINTPSVVAFIFLVMAPAYNQAKASGVPNPERIAWQIGLFACLLSGIIETVGAFVADWLRRNTPRAALLCALSGVAITFISMGFIFQMFNYPLITIVPMFILLGAYAGKVKFPFSLPGGLVSVIVGAILAWVLYALSDHLPATWSTWHPPRETFKMELHLPIPVLGDMVAMLNSQHAWQYLAVIFPMGLFNVLGSLQNLESAEAAGDRYETRPSMLVNGLGTIVAAAFGSPFPTTIYIGHPGWKAMGARAGYSIYNGVAIVAVCLVGGTTLVQEFVPIEAMLPILLWIGIVITSQAFADVPKRHTMAVAIGLIPAMAAWALEIIINSTLEPGTYLKAAESLPKKGLFLQGILALDQGFLVISVILSATLAMIIDRKFLAAAGWLGAAAVLSMIGLIHAYTLTPFGPVPKFGLAAAPEFAIGYALSAGMMLWFHVARDKNAPALIGE